MMRTRTLTTPQFVHDCATCKFIGHRDGFDVYMCDATLLARYGSDPDEVHRGLEVLTNGTSFRSVDDRSGPNALHRVARAVHVPATEPPGSFSPLAMLRNYAVQQLQALEATQRHPHAMNVTAAVLVEFVLQHREAMWKDLNP
jgi:hypothetical protein